MKKSLETMNLLSIKQASEMLGFSTSYLRYMTNIGKLECVRLGNNHRFFDKKKLFLIKKGLENSKRMVE